MVAPQQEEVARVLDLVGQQQADHFQGELAPVDVVPQEQVVGLRRVLAVVEQPQQVGVLPVDVS